MSHTVINPAPKIYPEKNISTCVATIGDEIDEIEIYDMIRDIRDPEHPYTLEQLRVVSEDKIFVNDMGDSCHIRIEFTPTVPHCSLANLIGLCIRERLKLYLHKPSKIDIFVTPGSHETEEEINKQINDKERVQAAIENPYLYDTIKECLKEPE